MFVEKVINIVPKKSNFESNEMLLRKRGKIISAVTLNTVRDFFYNILKANILFKIFLLYNRSLTIVADLDNL